VTDTGDTRSLTYAEIGKARGISAASAKRLALRHGWRKVAGNDGLARVSVPVTWLETSPEAPLAISPVTPEANVTNDMSPVTVPVAWLIEARADAARKEGDAAAARAELERLAAAHAAELERLAATHGAELTRLLADRDHERAERAKLTELLADAAAPWWRRLLGRRP
jgi:hypothetical protein